MAVRPATLLRVFIALLVAGYGLPRLAWAEADPTWDCSVDGTPTGRYESEFGVWGCCPKTELKGLATPCESPHYYNDYSMWDMDLTDGEGFPLSAQRVSAPGAAGRGVSGPGGQGLYGALSRDRMLGDDPCSSFGGDGGASAGDDEVKSRDACCPKLMEKRGDPCAWRDEGMRCFSGTALGMAANPATTEVRGSAAYYAGSADKICEQQITVGHHPQALNNHTTNETTFPGEMLTPQVPFNSVMNSMPPLRLSGLDNAIGGPITQLASFRDQFNFNYDRTQSSGNVIRRSSDRAFLTLPPYATYRPSDYLPGQEQKMAQKLEKLTPEQIAQLRGNHSFFIGEAFAMPISIGSLGSQIPRGIMCAMEPKTCQFTSHFDDPAKVNGIEEKFYKMFPHDAVINTPGIKLLPNLMQKLGGGNMMSLMKKLGGNMLGQIMQKFASSGGTSGGGSAPPISRSDYARCLQAMAAPPASNATADLKALESLIQSNCPAHLLTCLQSHGGYSEKNLNACYMAINEADTLQSQANSNNIGDMLKNEAENLARKGISKAADFIFGGNPLGSIKSALGNITPQNLGSLGGANITQLSNLLTQKIPGLNGLGGLAGNLGQFFGNLGQMPKMLADFKQTPFSQLFSSHLYDFRSHMAMFPERDMYSPCIVQKTCYVSKKEHPLSFWTPYGRSGAPAQAMQAIQQFTNNPSLFGLPAGNAIRNAMSGAIQGALQNSLGQITGQLGNLTGQLGNLSNLSNTLGGLTQGLSNLGNLGNLGNLASSLNLGNLQNLGSSLQNLGQLGSQLGQLGQLGSKLGNIAQLGNQLGNLGQLANQLGNIGQLGGQLAGQLSNLGQIGGQLGQLSSMAGQLQNLGGQLKGLTNLSSLGDLKNIGSQLSSLAQMPGLNQIPALQNISNVANKLQNIDQHVRNLGNIGNLAQGLQTAMNTKLNQTFDNILAGAAKGIVPGTLTDVMNKATAEVFGNFNGGIIPAPLKQAVHGAVMQTAQQFLPKPFDDPNAFGPYPSPKALGMPPVNQQTGAVYMEPDGSMYYANRPTELIDQLGNVIGTREPDGSVTPAALFAKQKPKDEKETWDLLAEYMNEHGGLDRLPEHQLNRLAESINAQFAANGSTSKITADVLRIGKKDLVALEQKERKEAAYGPLANLLESVGVSPAVAMTDKSIGAPMGAATGNRNFAGGNVPAQRNDVRCAGKKSVDQYRVDVIEPRYMRFNGQLLQRIVYNRWCYADLLDPCRCGKCPAVKVCAPKPCNPYSPCWWAPCWRNDCTPKPHIGAGPNQEFPIAAVRYDYGADNNDIGYAKRITWGCKREDTPLYQEGRKECNDFIPPPCATKAYNCRRIGGKKYCGYSWAFHAEVKFVLDEIWKGDFNPDVGQNFMADACESLAKCLPNLNKFPLGFMPKMHAENARVAQGSSFINYFGTKRPYLCDDRTGQPAGTPPGGREDFAKAIGAYVTPMIGGDSSWAQQTFGVSQLISYLVPSEGKPKPNGLNIAQQSILGLNSANAALPSAAGGLASNANSSSVMCCHGGNGTQTGGSCPVDPGDPKLNMMETYALIARTVQQSGHGCLPKVGRQWWKSDDAFVADFLGATVSVEIPVDGETETGVLRPMRFGMACRGSVLDVRSSEQFPFGGGAKAPKIENGADAVLDAEDECGGKVIVIPRCGAKPGDKPAPTCLGVVTSCNSEKGFIDIAVTHVGTLYDACMFNSGSGVVLNRRIWQQGELPDFVESVLDKLNIPKGCEVAAVHNGECEVASNIWNSEMKVYSFDEDAYIHTGDSGEHKIGKAETAP